MFISKDIVFIEDDDDDYFEKNKIKFNLLALCVKEMAKDKTGRNETEHEAKAKRAMQGELRYLLFDCLLNSKRQSAQKAGKRQRR